MVSKTTLKGELESNKMLIEKYKNEKEKVNEEVDSIVEKLEKRNCDLEEKIKKPN